MSRNSDDGMGAGMAAAGGAFVLGLLLLAGGAYLAFKALPPIARGIVGLTRLATPALAAFSRRLLHWPVDGPLTPATTIAFSAILWVVAGLVIGLLLLVVASPVVILIFALLGLILGAFAGAAVSQRPAGQVSENLDDYLSW